MKVSGPEHHRLTFNATKCSACFSGLATNTFPKLYVVAISGELIYVGVTKRKMSARFGAAGWNRNGRNGYHGYSWRHNHTEADLYVWSHDDAPNSGPNIEHTADQISVQGYGLRDRGCHAREEVWGTTWLKALDTSRRHLFGELIGAYKAGQLRLNRISASSVWLISHPLCHRFPFICN